MMGSYGIGPARIAAAAIEQGADEQGIVWPRAIAPWSVHLVSLGKAGERRSERPPSGSTRSCASAGGEVIYDDRDAGPGEKLTDAELLGCPLRLVVGRRGLADGVVEAQVRRGGEERGCASTMRPREAPRSGRSRREHGLSRGPQRHSAGADPAALRARPQRPAAARRPGRGSRSIRWTIPNFVGYARLAGIPLFLYLAFESGDGRTAGAAIVFWLIAAGDYVDGFLARVTGQYSRLGAMLDPLIDRLTILSGVVVCWHFELLPRWALAVLVAPRGGDARPRPVRAPPRGRHQGQLVRRVAVFPIMAWIFFAMVVDGWVPEALLVLGVVLAIVATVLYARDGVAESARAGKMQGSPVSITFNPRLKLRATGL